MAVSFKHQEQLDTDIEYIYLNLPLESRFDIYFTSLIITNRNIEMLLLFE